MNWESFIFSNFDKHERFHALDHVASYIPKAEFYKLFADIWSNSESVFLNLDIVEKYLRNTENKTSMMDEDELAFLENLPNLIKIYRGCGVENQHGWSWTIDKEKAKWFAYRYSGETPLLVEATVHKSEVIAYINHRNESEIIVDPKNAKLTRKKKLSPQSVKTRNSVALYLLAQTGNLSSPEMEDKKDEMRLHFAKTKGTSLEKIYELADSKIKLYAKYNFDEKVKYWEKFKETAKRIYTEGSVWDNI